MRDFLRLRVYEFVLLLGRLQFGDLLLAEAAADVELALGLGAVGRVLHFARTWAGCE